MYFSTNEDTVENVCGIFNIVEFTGRRMVFTLQKMLLYKKIKEKKKTKVLTL